MTAFGAAFPIGSPAGYGWETVCTAGRPRAGRPSSAKAKAARPGVFALGTAYCYAAESAARWYSGRAGHAGHAAWTIPSGSLNQIVSSTELDSDWRAPRACGVLRRLQLRSISSTTAAGTAAHGAASSARWARPESRCSLHGDCEDPLQIWPAGLQPTRPCRRVGRAPDHRAPNVTGDCRERTRHTLDCR